ncbi:MAG: DUF4290 domain-containing protein [Saprospiraceae bacterium]|nr:DUF4290 domain-containing protein [Saprospiraceae bacterium]
MEEATNNLIYNSQKEALIIPEYGRNVQELVKYCKSIEDPKIRQACAEEIVELMFRMSTQNKNTSEFRSKLWKHLFHIAGYDLDVKPPEDVDIQEEDFHFQPEKPEYPEHTTEFRHYGRIVKKMVDKALEMDEGPERDQFLEILGSYMKLAYRTWNREHYVSDEIIKQDLKAMTKGTVDIEEKVSLDYLKNTKINTSSSRKRKGKSGGRRSNKSRRRR